MECIALVLSLERSLAGSRIEEPDMKKTSIILKTICFTSLFAMVAGTSWAHGIEEFDRSSGVWKISPRKITRTNTPGWQNVERQGDGALVVGERD